MVEDPSGILERAPELLPLCDNPRVRRAVEAGDPLKLYRVLWWQQFGAAMKPHRATIRALLAHRRLFAVPLKSSPFLGTINSMGASFVGASELDQGDGTHIATHALVVLFKVPVFPFGAYVVAPGESKVLRSSWHIFARVPMGTASYLYSRLFAVGLLGAVLAAAGGALWSSRYHGVHVVNGFDQPLLATVGGRTTRVGGNSRVLLADVPVGRQKARAATEAGVEASAAELDVRSGSDPVVWNIGGAAPLYTRQVVYHRQAATATDPQEPPAATVLCGQEAPRLSGIDDVFTDPPEQVSMSKSEQTVSRTRLAVADSPAAGWQSCAASLYAEGHGKDALRIVEGALRLSDNPRELWPVAALLASPDPADALRVATLFHQKLPDDIEASRDYQNQVLESGDEAALVAEYNKMAGAHPDSADAQYLSARLLRGKAWQEAMLRLAARFPTSVSLVRSAFLAHLEAGRWKEADQTFQRLGGLPDAHADRLLGEEAVALVRMGRSREAAALVLARFQDGEPGARRGLARLHAQLQLLDHQPDPDALIARLEAEGHARPSPAGQGAPAGQEAAPAPRDWSLRSGLGLPIPDEAKKASRGLAFLELLERDPALALTAASALGEADVVGLKPEAWALAFAEAHRAGAQAAIASLSRKRPLLPYQRELLVRYVRGEDVSLDDANLPFECQPAAHLVRSRNLALASQRSALLEAARRADPLQGIVSRAALAWKD